MRPMLAAIALSFRQLRRNLRAVGRIDDALLALFAHNRFCSSNFRLAA
jgi:hypothetical protein